MFIPRHPVVENQFCSYSASSTSTGVGGVVAYAGSVVKLVSDSANQEPIVLKMAHGDTEQAFGLIMQKVKTGYHQVHPTGFMMPGDLGSSDVIAQPSYDANGNIDGTKEAPVGVAHMGIWDTVHYTCEMTVANTIASGDNMKPGDMLYPAADEAKLTNNANDASDGTASTDKSAGKRIGALPAVAMVVKGASVAKCQANFNNTTLYPIRVKLFV